MSVAVCSGWIELVNVLLPRSLPKVSTSLFSRSLLFNHVLVDVSLSANDVMSISMTANGGWMTVCEGSKPGMGA